MDRIADHLGLDPAEMRKQHAIPPDSITANWIRIGTLALGKCIDKVVAGSGWKDKFRKLPHGKGIGIACSAYMNEMPPDDRCEVTAVKMKWKFSMARRMSSTCDCFNLLFLKSRITAMIMGSCCLIRNQSCDVTPRWRL